MSTKIMLLFDFDDTLVSGHMHNYFSGTLKKRDLPEQKSGGLGSDNAASQREPVTTQDIDDYIENNGIKNKDKLLQVLKSAAADPNISIAITSYTKYPNAIKYVVENHLGLTSEQAAKISIFGGFPNEYMSGMPKGIKEQQELVGKNFHIKKAVEQFCKSEDTVPAKIVLVDDAETNIALLPKLLEEHLFQDVYKKCQVVGIQVPLAVKGQSQDIQNVDAKYLDEIAEVIASTREKSPSLVSKFRKLTANNDIGPSSSSGKSRKFSAPEQASPSKFSKLFARSASAAVTSSSPTSESTGISAKFSNFFKRSASGAGVASSNSTFYFDPASGVASSNSTFYFDPASGSESEDEITGGKQKSSSPSVASSNPNFSVNADSGSESEDKITGSGKQKSSQLYSLHYNSAENSFSINLFAYYDAITDLYSDNDLVSKVTKESEKLLTDFLRQTVDENVIIDNGFLIVPVVTTQALKSKNLNKIGDSELSLDKVGSSIKSFCESLAPDEKSRIVQTRLVDSKKNTETYMVLKSSQASDALNTLVNRALTAAYKKPPLNKEKVSGAQEKDNSFQEVTIFSLNEVHEKIAEMFQGADNGEIIKLFNESLKSVLQKSFGDANITADRTELEFDEGRLINYKNATNVELLGDVNLVMNNCIPILNRSTYTSKDARKIGSLLKSTVIDVLRDAGCEVISAKGRSLITVQSLQRSAAVYSDQNLPPSELPAQQSKHAGWLDACNALEGKSSPDSSFKANDGGSGKHNAVYQNDPVYQNDALTPPPAIPPRKLTPEKEKGSQSPKSVEARSAQGGNGVEKANRIEFPPATPLDQNSHVTAKGQNSPMPAVERQQQMGQVAADPNFVSALQKASFGLRGAAAQRPGAGERAQAQAEKAAQQPNVKPDEMAELCAKMAARRAQPGNER